MLHKTTVILIPVLIVVFGVLTVKAITTSPTLHEEIPSQILYRNISFDYRVYPVESSLYPRDTDPLLPDNDLYFTNLTEKIQFDVTCEIIAAASIPEETDFDVFLVLKSEGQWEKKLPFAPKIVKNFTEEEKITYSCSFDVPLQEAEQLAEAITEETKVMPRSGYDLIIHGSLSTPPINGQGIFLESKSYHEVFNGEYKFMLNGYTIEPDGELLHEDKITVMESISKINRLNLLGCEVGVPLARILFPSFFATVLIMGGGLYINQQKKSFNTVKRMEFKLEKINKRYGSKIVQAEQLKGVTEKTLRVEVKTFRRLLSLADEMERPIIQVTSIHSDGQKMAFFYLFSGEALYYYLLTSVGEN